MSNVAAIPARILEDEDVSPVQRAQVAAILTLAKALEPAAQALLLSELTALRPMTAPRAGDVLGAVIKFLPRRSTWTVEDVKAEVGAAGVSAAPKEIYNALSYLQRRGQLRRVAYGKYVVCGALLELPNDIAGPPTHRASEHD